VLNYNGTQWLERCLTSLREQTLSEQLEVIVADNASPDNSHRLASSLVQDWPAARAVDLKENLGYSEGNNRAASQAQGRYLFFLNNDVWLEPDCLEKLLERAQATQAGIAAPLVMDYASNAVQTTGWAGFDIFGLLSGPTRQPRSGKVFVAAGCSLLIESGLFKKLGGFDPEFFMYADEYDLCWRAWVMGEQVVFTPLARIHHRGAASVNPRGDKTPLEVRTSDTKRFYANRNSLLVLLKNAEHLLLGMVLLQLILLIAEALVMGLLTQRWGHIRRAYVDPVLDCWRLRHHILRERLNLNLRRKHGDLWMLRFLRGGLNRWNELRRCRRLGLPKVDAL
jgi:GT2 family glycosyltransferase